MMLQAVIIYEIDIPKIMGSRPALTGSEMGPTTTGPQQPGTPSTVIKSGKRMVESILSLIEQEMCVVFH